MTPTRGDPNPTPEPAFAPAHTPARARVTAIDRLRGLVMVLMTIDHADGPLNQSHYWINSAHFQGFGVLPEPLSFATRTLTHLCAPTFLFLAGVSVVLSAASAAQRGASSGSVDRHLSSRGVVLIALDPVVMTFTFGVWWAFGTSHMLVLQVLYAIGIALVLSPILRRLPSWALLAGAGALVVATEQVMPHHTMAMPPWPPAPGDLWASLLFTGGWHLNLAGNFGLMIMYPTLPWVAAMMLGLVFGRWLQAHGAAAAARLAMWCGAGSLLAFGLIRGINAWGNTQLPRDSHALIEWLDVSKYPPGVAYLTLTLGVMFLLLAGLLTLDARRGDAPPRRDPMRVLGKAALLYYLLHIPLLTAASAVVWLIAREPGSGNVPTPLFGVGATRIAWPLAVLVLYPVCAWYGRYKERHRNVITRFL